MKKIPLLLLICLTLLSCKNNSDYNFWKFYQSDESELYQQIRNNNLNRIEKICKKNPDIISKSYSEKKYSVLHYACDNGKIQAAEKLLQCGYNPNAVDEQDQTPLYSVFNPYTLNSNFNLSAICKLLIDYKADVNFQKTKKIVDEFGNDYTPFMNALKSGQVELARIMYSEGNADVNLKTETGMTAVISSLLSHNLNSAVFVISECKADATVVIVNEDSKEEVDVPYLLRKKILPIDSAQYKMKLEIIDELTKQGIDYYSARVPEEAKILLSKLYPDKWEKYIKIY